ncbi:MAG: hypothetical protein ACLGIF_02980 [Actinomycetes bacterium]
MRNVYRALAFTIAALVGVQAAFHAYGSAGLGKWVQGGGVLDKAAIESPDLSFPGLTALMLHGMFGMMVIPALALLLVISSFFARVPGGIKWALVVFGVVVAQVAFGLFGHSIIQLAILHGLNALVLFGVAVSTGLRVRRVTQATAAPQAESVSVQV